MIRWILWLLTVGTMILFLDGWFIASLGREILGELPLLTLLGWLAGRWWKRDLLPNASSGLAALFFFLGSLAFWMIPRSLDEGFLSSSFNELRHADLLLAGFFLCLGFRRLMGEIKIAFLLLLISMFFSVGILLSNYDTLLCGVYTIEQQKFVGHAFLGIGAGSFLLLLGVGIWKVKDPLPPVETNTRFLRP